MQANFHSEPNVVFSLSKLRWVCEQTQHSFKAYSFENVCLGSFFFPSPPYSIYVCLSKRSRCTPFGFGWLLLALNFLLKRANREPCVCSTPQRQFQTLFLALWSSLMSRIIDLNDLIVGGKFKCAILITCYPRQIKSLCVKSTLFWITYKTSIYWINVGSNFILMWLTVCCSPSERDKNTQTYNCVATLHLTCLFLLLSF